jgi:hypothetical protein
LEQQQSSNANKTKRHEKKRIKLKFDSVNEDLKKKGYMIETIRIVKFNKHKNGFKLFISGS